MWKVHNKTKIPIYSWINPKNVELDAWKQVENIANLPFAYHHVALMPDVHIGYGMPIGGILATVDYIVPNAVGVDIGCGVIAVSTNINFEEHKKELEKICHIIFNSIPLGFNKYKEAQDDPVFDKVPNVPTVKQEINNAKKQVGTLGGGNHFIDILVDEEGKTWVMIHSGSRNIGKKIADFYHHKAIEFSLKKFSSYPTNELAALKVDSPDGKNYILAMKFAQEFAYANRHKMMKIVEKIFCDNFKSITFEEEINIHHNYAELELHFGNEVWVHRKGATSAKLGQPGIIPGSMGTASYITEGLGNPDSFSSCSHGSGRVMGRREAKRQFTFHQMQKKLKERNIILFANKNTSAIEEDFRVYKDIEMIIDLQKNLAKIKYKLIPKMVIIG